MEPPSPPPRLLLVLGPPRVGKTTVLQKVLAAAPLSVGGLLTLAATEDSNPGRRRFVLVAVDGRHRDVPPPDRSLITPCHLPTVSTVRYEDLATRGVAALDRARRNHRIVVVDELGFVQLHCPAFRDAVDRLVADRDAIVLATGPWEGSPYVDDLRQRPDSRCYVVSPESRSTLADQILDHLRLLLDRPASPPPPMSV